MSHNEIFAGDVRKMSDRRLLQEARDATEQWNEGLAAYELKVIATELKRRGWTYQEVADAIGLGDD